MRKSFRYKLYRSRKNRYLFKQVDIAARIYNHCIAVHKRFYSLYGKHLNKNKLQKHLTKLKRQERFKFWSLVGSQAIQEITERIEKGYERFFDNVKKRKAGLTKERVSPPKFRKLHKYKSFTLKQAGWSLFDDNEIIIQKRRYKFSKSREIEGQIKTVNVKRDAVGDFWISFSCEVDDPKSRTTTGKIAGFDFGLKNFLTSSEFTPSIQSPLFHKESLYELKRANRELSRKEKGSRNRARARRHLALTHRRVANKRDDYQWKLARTLVLKYDYLFFEDLHVKAMSRLWGRKIHDLGFSHFMSKIESKAREFGSKLHRIDRFYPSSKECSSCHHIKKDLSLKDRIYNCFCCGLRIDRDRNAAINIKMVGASTIGLEVLRPSFEGSLGDSNIRTPESPGLSPVYYP